MTTNLPAYPLQWPQHRTRTPGWERKRAQFQSHGKPLTIAGAIDRVQNELDRLQAQYPVISSNVELKLDGRPRSESRPPDDPAIAIYFMLGKKQMCMACDRWDRVADNIAAVAGHIDALRRTQRYGVVDQHEAFSGFAQLDSVPDWMRVLGFAEHEKPTAKEVDAAFKSKAKKMHADKGGGHEDMVRLNTARTQALQEIANG